jgi:murein L,D-transpeptidase YcbB/YkuD
MPVVIGSAYDHRTPVMLQPLTRVEFHPYWNVPPTIVRAEILPALAADPGYLRKLRMEVVGVRDSVLGDSVTPAIAALLTRGRLRIRQRPGPWNALGLTKFTFPNHDDVYLHGTPDTTLFRRARRDLSHGCIRLQRPAMVAEWALAGGNWARARIDSTLAGSADTVWAPVVRPTSVLIFYTTAVAMPDGEARFYQDIYGHDHELAVSLRDRHRSFRHGAGTPPPVR